MKITLRTLFAALLALWLALPSVGGEGGENAGGSGVWILPRTTFMAPSTGGGSVPRMSFTISDLNRDASLVGSAEMGQAVATLVDSSLGLPTRLQVVGKAIVLPSSMMLGMLHAGVTDADIVVVDASLRGYRIPLSIDSSLRSILVTVE
jgi:hypothetical protein